MTQPALFKQPPAPRLRLAVACALVPPIAWALRLVSSYPLVPWACEAQSRAPLVAVSAVALLFTGGAGLGCWLLWRQARARGDTDQTRRGLFRFITTGGILLSALFSLMVVLESVPIFTDDPCTEVDLSPRRMRGTDALLKALAVNEAHAHVLEEVPPPAQAWMMFNPDPLILLALAVAAGGYVRGVRRIWRRQGRGRGIRRWQAVSFGLGLSALALALLSPIDTVGGLLFSVHMVQHLLLSQVAAPLLVLGWPDRALWWALPRRGRRWLGAVMSRRTLRALSSLLQQPVVVLLLHAGGLWVWHIPTLYEAALQYEFLHALEHLSFLVPSLLLWGLVRSGASRSGVRAGHAIFYLFIAATQSALLGVLLGLAHTPWYEPHAAGRAGWTMTGLEDQQLGGFLMWVPGGVLYAIAAVILAARWISASERLAARYEGVR
jgi:putative membrane protein